VVRQFDVPHLQAVAIPAFSKLGLPAHWTHWCLSLTSNLLDFQKKISKKKTKKHLSIEHLSNVTFVTEKQ
jgi:hypothetical protein